MIATNAEVLESIRREKANVEWISETVANLRKRYGGRYIAVRDRRVIDSDKSLDDLLSRVRGRESVTVEFITELEYLWLP